MSNTQFVFINQTDIPAREQLQGTIDQLGYDLKLDPELSLKDDEGFSPCILNGESKVGFELDCQPTSNVVAGNKDFEKMAGGKDTCITMTWGRVLIVSYALMKEYNAITTYEGEELDTLESLHTDIHAALNEEK